MALPKENREYFSLTGEQARAIVGLRALIRDLNQAVPDGSEKPKQEPLEAAISNFRFINEQITPSVEGFYKNNTEKRLRFSVPLTAVRSIITEPPIIYNARECPLKLAFGTTEDKKPVELTEERLRRFMQANTHSSVVEAFGTIPKVQIAEKFIKNILV